MSNTLDGHSPRGGGERADGAGAGASDGAGGGASGKKKSQSGKDFRRSNTSVGHSLDTSKKDAKPGFFASWFGPKQEKETGTPKSKKHSQVNKDGKALKGGAEKDDAGGKKR